MSSGGGGEAPAGATARPGQGAYAMPVLRRPGRAGPVGAALMAALGTAVAIWPLTTVIAPGRWSAHAVATAAVVLVVGVIVRLVLRTRVVARVPMIAAVAVAQLVALAIAVTVLGFRDEGLWNLLPSPAVVQGVGDALAQAGEEVALGAAPLAATHGVTVAIALGAGVTAIVLDALIGARLPLVAVVVVTGVGVVPSVAVGGGVDIPWFLALAVTLLLLLVVRVDVFRVDAARADAEDTSPRTDAVSDAPPRWGTAATIGAAAVALSLLVAPVLPVSATGFSLGASTALNPTLRLGEDLRRPAPTAALTLITDDDRAPYLRIATLSMFDGEVWHADRSRTDALSEGLGDVSVPGAAVDEHRTSIRITGVSGDFLPLPYQATEVRGLEGVWLAMADNRTVVASNADAQNQNYTVETSTAAPTLEQIRASTASGAAAVGELRELPVDMPASIAEAAAEIAGAQPTDYDRLISLQTWFRAGFRYSLETPVSEGFDGTGVDAVARFLEVRQGYCVHFAGAFALMARSLGMPARIVVGYLPGTPTDQQQGEPVYQVTSDQLHAWPEVYFEGLGWIPFEPTATRGVATRFESGAGDGTDVPSPGTDPGTAPSAAPDPGDGLDRDEAAGGGDAPVLRPLDPSPVLWTVLGILAALLLPAAIRAVVRAVRFSRIRDGDALPAWREVADTLRDLGLPASAADSPRMRGARLTADRGVDPDAVAVLVGAVEHASYAPGQSSGHPALPADGDELARATRRILADLRASTSTRDRVGALVLPRSLLGARLPARSVG
ncbi:DUF3488 and transglutaminase-like domain-containing protein [Microbacterium pseudoresistens]|uniref:Transglutaminase-like putative cysteine protease n=1 Tax=Microbacterium pseudoresistens TaxID=640634 RepID=A0A7Y9EVJ5_9MICO|nr:DUF3488 and transglutaminase-like domain-containing protein [Microbacterium pseudoresistens]NYD54735.1 transglutaminase-like putative cysteine protease [Microbacterium pseudoresistens]